MALLLETLLCAGCGTPMDVEPCTGILEFVNSLDAYCDDCAVKKSTAMERDRQMVDCRARFYDAQRRGLLTEQFRRASFAVSRKEVEAMNQEAWNLGRNWARKDNLYIFGHIGTGKTFLALCALRKAFVSNLSVAETTARQFVKTADLFRDTENLFNAWKFVDVLLLDDIDKARWTLDRIDALWELMNTRMSGGRRTIITGNVSLRDMAILMRERTGDGEREIKNTARADAAMERLKPIQQIELHGKSLRT